ncbi:GNAT family N-acetyltransferase [Rheinheimera gaetbuli]
MSSSSYHVKIYPAEMPLSADLQQWLNKHNSHAIFASYEWFHAVTCFKNQHDSCRDTQFEWLFVFQNDAPCVAMPLEKSGKKLKLITNFYTPYADIFFDSAMLNPHEAWELLFAQLNFAYPNWLSLEVAPLYSAQFDTLLALQTRTQISVFKYYFSANYSTQYTNFETYWNSRSSRLRNTYSRRLKTLAKQNYAIEIHSSVNEEIKQAYWQIYKQSWKVQEPSDDFINWLMHWADQQQRFKLGLLSINGVPAAFQLWLLDGTTAYIYKLAQDKQFDAFSPGTILTKYMIEQLSADNAVNSVDFLLGDDNFKALWMDNKTSVIGAEIINFSTISGKLLVALYKLRDYIKRTTGINFSSNRFVKLPPGDVNE